MINCLIIFVVRGVLCLRAVREVDEELLERHLTERVLLHADRRAICERRPDGAMERGTHEFSYSSTQTKATICASGSGRTGFEALEHASERLHVDRRHAEADELAEAIVLDGVRELRLHVLQRSGQAVL